MVLNTTAATKGYYEQQQKKRQSIDNSMIRFPKLDECAHFHYEFAELNNFHVSLIINENCSANNRQSASEGSITNIRNLYLFVRVQSLNRSWTVRRNLQDFRFLDIQLHKCVFDRKHSSLRPLNLSYFSSFDSLESIVHFVAQYLQRLSQIVGGCFLTCGPVLHWFEIDNRGNRLINEESDINTPAIGAAFVIKKHNKSDVETEISLDIGELVSVIEMPPVNESFYWKGKKGFEVGFFPAECVQLIDDKISRKTEELPLRPLNKCTSPTLLHRASDPSTSVTDEIHSPFGSHLDNPHYHQSVMRKHGLIAALFRTFASGRIGGRRRDQLKSSGILKERVFGCDLCEHLANTGHDLPPVLTTCAAYIEANGLNANGIYRLSGVSSTINRLRTVFDEDLIPAELTDQPEEEDISTEPIIVDIHAVSSLLKLYFRELPNPLLTFSLYESFVAAMRDDSLDDSARLQAIRSLVISLPPPHWRTLRFLIRHLSFVAKFEAKTGMTPKNLAIVWAPNLLRSRDLDQHVGIEALHVIGTQAVLTEFLILNCDKIFDREEHEIHPPKPLYSPFNYPKHGNAHVSSKCLKYIDVGPEIIPGKYHTIISIRPSNQAKRSKFNLHNWKKFHFFSTRSHNGRHRPSLFGDENASVAGGSTFRKLTNFDGHSTSDSTSNFNYHKSVSSRLSIRNKSVKRSQSFDSYFKKLRTSSSGCSNKNCCIDQDDANNTMVDINRNKFDPLSKNETIFEVEEMAIDCESHLTEMNKLHTREMNNNLPQIDEEPSKTEVTPQVTATDQSNQVQQMDTNYSAPSREAHCELLAITHATNCELIDSMSNSIPSTKSSPSHTSSCSSLDSQLAVHSTNPIDTHSLLPIVSSTSSSVCSYEQVAPAPLYVMRTESLISTKSTLEGIAICSQSDYVIIDEPNSSLAQSSSHSSLNSFTVNEPNESSLSTSDVVDSGTVQSANCSDSSSPTIACSLEATCIATTMTNASVSAPVTIVSEAAPLHSAEEITERERIERIKEERRNQIRQNFAQQLAQSKGADPCNKSPSRIPIAFRTDASNLPDIVNSSECSPVRLRNKPPTGSYANKTAWRNSEASMGESLHHSISPNRSNVSEYRRSVPNLDLHLQSGDYAYTDQNSPTCKSQSTRPSPTSPLKGPLLERTNSMSNSTPNRKPKVTTSISVDENNKSGTSTAAPRAKIAVTPLRTININKRARIIDPKTLALMFEQHNSTDNV